MAEEVVHESRFLQILMVQVVLVEFMVPVPTIYPCSVLTVVVFVVVLVPMKALQVMVTESQHRNLRVMAFDRGVSMGTIVGEWIDGKCRNEVPHGTPVSMPTLPPVRPEPVQSPIPTMKVIKSPREAVERLKVSAAPRGRAFAAYE